MKMPLFREAVISNISAVSKKMAEISVRLYKESDELIYVSKDKTRRTVLGYTDPNTGLFIVNTKDIETSKNHDPYKLFRDEATKYAQYTVNEKLQELSNLYNEDKEKYETQYKPLQTIENELNAYLTDKQAFYIDIQKQVDVLISKQLPHINEWLVYEDDQTNTITGDNYIVTQKVPYNNPKNQTLTDEQTTLVDNFLNVFLDDSNKDILSWYFGAILLNLPMQDDRISKALIVSSSNGGSGKSTLIGALADAVVTHPYRVVDSGFDKHFRANDKFSTSDLPTCRLGIYSEAYFNADTGDNVTHDFTGLDESELKSWITDGYVANEKKYADKQIAKLTGMQIILTNHPPVIPEQRTDLSRRFISVNVKPSDMVKDKAKALNIHSEKGVYAYVQDNAQAFANYFVHSFNAQPNRYQTLQYNTEDFTSEISKSQQVYISQKDVQKSELIREDAYVIIATLCSQNEIPSNEFIDLLTRERLHPSKNPDIRWEPDALYLASTKSFFVKHKMVGLRDELKDLLGSPVKKFGNRMFKLNHIQK